MTIPHFEKAYNRLKKTIKVVSISGAANLPLRLVYCLFSLSSLPMQFHQKSKHNLSQKTKNMLA